jgi:hypothetical protein
MKVHVVAQSQGDIILMHLLVHDNGIVRSLLSFYVHHGCVLLVVEWQHRV